MPDSVATVADFTLAFAPALADPTPAFSAINLPEPYPGTPLPSYLVAEVPAAPDAEADAALAPRPLLPVAAETSTTERREEAAVETAGSSAVAGPPVPASGPKTLASLPTPATNVATASPIHGVEEAASNTSTAAAAVAPSEPVAQPDYLELRPASGPFDAPNLNFQIIQYARFAVPLALTAEPFAVIYAPAWPTWLAAQELRHRTGCPLVLHVAALAAAETEPLALAAGWPAEIQRQALHRADLILTETLALAHRLRRELDLPVHRVRPVPAADAAAVAHALSTAQVR
ncbi:MAG: hypothetical protein EOO36_11830 [Cytophagaceae bacterium]|nr:MAG: hypothetical protein EOO36_11830 [Cytophagaceae bacterium]